MTIGRFWDRKFFRAAICAIGLLAISHRSAAADPFQEMKFVSKLPQLDLQKLERGEIVSLRGPLGNFSRGIYAENCFFLHAPTPAVAKTLIHWDPSKHSELEVLAFHEYRWPAAANDWDALALNASRKTDQWLIDRTWQLLSGTGADRDLHLLPDEISAFRETARALGIAPSPAQRATEASNFWRKVLKVRNEGVTAGGLAALPPYSADLSARTEFKGLMSLAPQIAAHFSFSSENSQFPPAAKPGEEIVPYWEAALVRGHTNLAAGVMWARPDPESYQVVDCTYYTSDTYYLAVILYKLWPMKNGTLVWQVDFASAPFRSFTGGLDRVIAGKEMLKETAQTIKIFRSDVEK